jgi:hypothetical protein
MLTILSKRRWLAHFSVELDEEGCLPSGLLDPGRRYVVWAQSGDWDAPEARVRYLDWGGTETEIDLSKLSEETSR